MKEYALSNADESIGHNNHLVAHPWEGYVSGYMPGREQVHNDQEATD